MSCFLLGKVVKGASRGSKVEMKEKPKPKSLKAGEGQEKVIEYQGALDLMTECARLLHIRWLQVKLMKELIDVIYK